MRVNKTGNAMPGSKQPKPELNYDSLSDSGSDSDSDIAGYEDVAPEFEPRPTKSLFDQTVLETPEEAVAYDAKTHGWNIKDGAKKLGLDVYGRMKLVNWIRRENATASRLAELTSSDFLDNDDALFKPTLEDDAMLQLGFDEDWSDDEAEADAPAPTSTPAGPTSSTDQDEVSALKAELAKAQAGIASLQALVSTLVNTDDSAAQGDHAPEGSKGKGKVRDDDTHYFDSYAVNDIHEIMLKDTTRTVSYARFILSNPQLFKGATVMDVGCGTGVLSMLAARAGAKHVYAIEASGLAAKSIANVKKNGLENVITVIQGKVEDIELPVKTVDIIISEWMGYMLLYESMLDSVLVARDRFLAPGGLMVPSQTRLVISAITGAGVWKDKVAFWDDVYGFDMTVMKPTYFEEGLVEIVDAKEVVTDEYVVKDIDSHEATPASLDFKSSFTLNSTISESTTVRAFVTHFDTFFANVPGRKGGAVEILPFGDDEFQRPVQALDDGSQVSFTTGPKGKMTHWKQVVFLLKEAIELGPGDTIQGGFFCRKSTTNSRELDVEIHFSLVRASGEKQETKIELYKVR